MSPELKDPYSHIWDQERCQLDVLFARDNYGQCEQLISHRINFFIVQ